MNVLLKIARIYIPDYLKKKKLQELFQLTAQAFQCDVPDTQGLSYHDCLKKFAQFTKTEADTVIQKDADLEVIKRRLFQNAFHMGQKLKKHFRITTQAEIMIMCNIIYRLLGIEFQGDMSGCVVIKRCFFSRFYTNQVCQLICALDQGLAAGLSAGGRLVFRERITDGKDCCRATFEMPVYSP